MADVADVPRRFLDGAPSPESLDYVANAKQFQLHSLLTEQRHPKTMVLSRTAMSGHTEEALTQLFTVDEDIQNALITLANDTYSLFKASLAAKCAIAQGRKIFIYGCGATGRLAKVVECALWKPFWAKVKGSKSIWEVLKGHLPETIDSHLIGEITGGDRALVSSLEGFEDLQIVGAVQLEANAISKGDVVFAVTEGGETSSVIGAILAALGKYDESEKSAKNLYFLNNNPDDVLRPFDRSRRVLEAEGVTKINLSTGPQAITGSTRMQATTISLFVLGVVLEHALHSLLEPWLTAGQLAELGFNPANQTIADRLNTFGAIRASVGETKVALSKFIELEASIYASDARSTYVAVGPSLMTVFTDVTERSPTFSLFPLDTTAEKERKSWIKVCTVADDLQDAWVALLARRFRGLDPERFSSDFEQIQNTYLRAAAIRSLANAGAEQEQLYDFSLSSALVQKGDLVVLVLTSSLTGSQRESIDNFVSSANQNEVKFAIVELSSKCCESPFSTLPAVRVKLDVGADDALGLRGQIALKMLLNAHSTAVMAKLGRVVGNTMTNVKPSNLKLIGRATYLIQLHVNAVLKGKSISPISYAEVNAVLFEAIDWKRANPSQKNSEVELAIVRVLEIAAGRRGEWREASEILGEQTLEAYINFQML